MGHEGAYDACYVDAEDDGGEDPAGLLREEVVGGVVDRRVLDHDHAFGLDRLLDHALPDLVARERDHERRHADEGDEGALERADQRARRNGQEDRDDPRDLVPVRQGQLRDDDPGDAADVADREVDLADQEDEDDTVGQQGDARHLRDDVADVAGAEEVLRLEGEEDEDHRQPDQHGPAAEVAAADVVEHAPEEALRHGSGRGGSGVRAHAGSGAVEGIPATFVGTPAVIALDDLVLGDFVAFVDADVAAEPQHGDPVGDLEDVVQVVRDQDDGEPLLGQALDELEHLLRLRDAERGGRLVEDHEPRVPHHRAGDGDGLPLAARQGRDRLPDRADRRHGEALHRLRGLGLHHRLLEPVQPVAGLAAEVHVLDDVEVVAEREVLVDDLDPELGGVLRAVDVHRLAVDDDLAAVRRVRAGDALDQGRLAGAVVADERHHLTGTDLEVDLAERLDRAEALRDPVELQERGRRVPRRSWSWVQKGGGAPSGRPPPWSLPRCSTSCTRRRRPSTSSSSR